MHRRFSPLPGMVGALALVVGGMTADVHAQRGGGAGQGRPATAGTQAQGHGRPDNPGAQRQTHRPTTPGETAGRTEHQPDADETKGPASSTGRPTVADQLNRDHGLAIQLAKLFPAGTNLADVAKDFKNLGQFVAAAHVANNNPNFTFDELKAKMFEGEGMTLGKAIHALDPSADATAEAAKAGKEADADIKAAGKGKSKSSDAS